MMTNRIAYVALFISILSLVSNLGGNVAIWRVSQRNHNALCNFHTDLQARYESGVQLLAKHPENPIHAYGIVIPRDVLVNQAANEKATLDSLAPLGCG